MKTVIAAVALMMTGAVHAECDSDQIYSYVQEGLSESEIRLICGIRPERRFHRGPGVNITIVEPNRSSNNKCCCVTVHERQSTARTYSTQPQSDTTTWIVTGSFQSSLPVQFCSGVRYDSEFSRTRSYCDGSCD